MKFLKNLFFIVVMFALVQSSFAQSTDAINYGPSTVGHVTISSPFAAGDLLRNYNADSAIAVAGQAGYGVIWTGSNYIVSNFNANLFFRYDANWVKRDSFAVSGGLGSFRDMAFAKGLMWGVNNTTNPGQIIGVDTGSKAVVKTITTSLVGLRGLTWDPIRVGFWCGTNSFSGPAVCVDTNGVTIPGATFAPGTIYGIGYDPNPSGTPMLTITRDMTPANTTQTVIARYNATSLAKIDSLVVTVPLQTPATSLASGGSEVYTNLIPGKRVSLGLVQSTPHRVIIVELGNLPVPPPVTTLVMYHDTTVATGLVKRLADRDSVAKYLPGLISGYDVTYFNQTTVLPSLTTYKTIILIETSFDGTPGGSLCLGPGSRTDIKNWLASGTTIDKKSLISIGGDQAYNYERALSTNVDTTFARTYCGFIYRVDSGMPSPATMTGLAADIGNTRNLLAPIGTGNTGYWPDGVSTTSGGLPVYKYGSHLPTDTLAAVSKNVGTSYFTVTSFQDPRYFVNGDLRPWLAALFSYAKTNGATLTSVTPQISSVAEKYSLSQNYPNPFNPTTKINFAIPSNGLVSLKIYDIAGKEVMTLVNKTMNVGTYSVEFNGALLSSGAYFYRLESGSFVETKKMMLVK